MPQEDFFLRFLLKAESDHAAMQEFAGHLGKVTGAFEAMRPVAIAAGTALAGASGAALKLAEDFDVSLRKVFSLTGISRDQFEKYKEQVLDLSTVVPKSAKDLADALYFVVSAGFSGSDAMKILEVSSKAATAGLTDTKTVADAITSALNAYKLSGSSAGDITGKLTQAVIEGKTEYGALAGSIGRVLPIAAQLGVSFDEVLASMSTMTRVGLNADEAATALRGTLNSLAKPTTAAREELAKFGLSAEDVRAQLREKGLLAVLQDMMVKTHGNVDELGHLFPNIRSLTGVLATAGSQGEQYAGILGRMKQANAEAGVDAFGKTMEGASGQIGLLRNQLEKMGIELGEKMLPYLIDFAKRAREIAEVVERWVKANPELAEFAAKGLAVAAALSAVSIVAGPLVGLIGGLAAVFGGPLLLTIGAIGVAAYLLVTHWTEVSESAQLMWKIVTALFEKGVAAVGAFFDWLGSTVHDVMSAIGETIGGFFSGIGTRIHDFITFWVDAWTAFTDHPLEKIGRFVGQAVGHIVKWIRDTASAIGDFFSKLPERLGSWLGSTWSAISDFVGSALATVGEWLSQTGASTSSFFSGLPARLGAWLTDAWIAIATFTMNAFDTVKTWVGNVAEGILEFFSSLPGKLLKFGKDAITGFIDGIMAAARNVTGAIGEFLRGFIGGFEEGLDSHSPSRRMMRIGFDATVGFAHGVESGTGLIGSAAAKLVGSMVGSVVDSFPKVLQAQAAVNPTLSKLLTEVGPSTAELIAAYAQTAPGSSPDWRDRREDAIRGLLGAGNPLHFSRAFVQNFIPLADLAANLVPAFQHGIDYVPHDTLAYVHQGERVVSADRNRGAEPVVHHVQVFLSGKQIADAVDEEWTTDARLSGRMP